jgi:hypothetical protein
MHKSAMKCNKTLDKWCKNKHGASKIMDTLETYQDAAGAAPGCPFDFIDTISFNNMMKRE